MYWSTVPELAELNTAREPSALGLTSGCLHPETDGDRLAPGCVHLTVGATALKDFVEVHTCHVVTDTTGTYIKHVDKALPLLSEGRVDE
jgi:hypothetical protein